MIQDIYNLFQSSQEPADRQIAESKAEDDISMEKLQKTVDRTSQAVDALITRWGRFVEEVVEPAVFTLFQDQGIDIKEVSSGVWTKRQGFAVEIDILAADDNDLVLVECETRLSQEDVDELLEKLARFKQSFPRYANSRVYGAVAGIEINEGIDSYASRQGLFVIKPSGESVAIANDENFQPAVW